MKQFYFIILLLSTQIFTKGQTLTPPFLENFNNTTLTTNGWYIPIPNGSHDFRWYVDQGDTLPNGIATPGLRMKLNNANNYVASPGINLVGGKVYTALFKQKVNASSGPRNMKIGYNTTRSLSGATFFYDFECPNNIYVPFGFVQHTPTFTPPTTGVYYLVYFYYNASGTSSYLFSYLDDLGVEETLYPTINLNTPANNFSRNEDYYTDSSKINFDVTASDADGTIAYVEYFADNILLKRDSFAPYQFVWKDANPDNYKVYAKATDNRGNVSTSDTSFITLNFRASVGALLPYAQWDFNSNNINGPGLSYWTFPTLTSGQTQNYTTNSLFRGSQCMYINAVANGNNFAASPGVYLQAGETYNVEFLGRGTSGSAKTFNLLYNQGATIVGATLISAVNILPVTTNASDASFVEPASLHLRSFTVPTSGVYNIIFNYPTAATNVNNIKVKIDQVRVFGNNLNLGPTVKLTYPIAALNYAENAKITFAADAKDIDGTVTKIEYYANGLKVAESTISPFNAVWTSPPVGNVSVYAKAFDNSGGYGFSATVIMTGVANQFKACGFLGTAANDEIRGVIIKENNDIVYAANIGEINIPTAQKYYVNGATDATAGAIIVMSSDGQTIKTITRVCAKIGDLSKDRNDNLYIAAVSEGVIKLNPWANTMLYKKAASVGRNVFRIDVGPKGKTVILEVAETNLDDETTTTGKVTLLDSAGNTLATCGGITQYSADVCIDENTETIVGVGFKNFNTLSEIGGLYFPVYVPVMKGFDFAGNLKWLGYDWGSDENVITNTPAARQWVNLSDNNMADARLNRCSMGKDGKLYISGLVYGGNHIFRYDPKDVMLAGKMATGGDNWFNLNNTGTEVHSYFGRYEPATGDVMKSQTFTARLPNSKGNTLRCDLGDIAADELGNIYLTGTSAFGYPMSVEYQPGEYTGGGFILKANFNMNSRLISIRPTTGGYGKALAVKNSNQFAYGGSTNSNYMYATSPAIQPLFGGGIDAFFGVFNTNACSLPNGSVAIAPTTFTKKGLAAYHLFTNDNCEQIATILPLGSAPISDSVITKVWVDAVANTEYVKRHFEITPYTDNGSPTLDANIKTGKITLYVTQAEFNDYNSLTSYGKLPVDPTDVFGRDNIKVIKYPGISSNGTGMPTTYLDMPIVIVPNSADIVWNNTKNIWEITVDVSGFSGFFITTNVVLPITWLQTSIQLNSQKQPVIFWNVNEQRINKYEIEMQMPNNIFEKIGIVNSIGNGTNNYSFTHNNIIVGAQYYRLKQIGTDGNFKYSNILKVTNGGNTFLNVYPNPSNGNVQISNNNQALLNTNCTVQALNGQQVHQFKITSINQSINLSFLPKGTYIISAQGLKSKVIIQ